MTDDRYLTFVARSSQGVKEYRVRTYGQPSVEQLEGTCEIVARWAFPDADCQVGLLDVPYLQGVLGYEPVHAFITAEACA